MTDRTEDGAWTPEQAPGFERPHLDRYVREWAADSREREEWGDADQSTYRFRRKVLEAVLAEFATLEKSLREARADKRVLEEELDRSGRYAAQENGHKRAAEAALTAARTRIAELEGALRRLRSTAPKRTGKEDGRD